jgi:hypothetical protein
MSQQAAPMMPLPKVNVPPAHLFAAIDSMDALPSSENAAQFPSQQTTAAGMLLVSQFSETRTNRLSMTVVVAIIVWNVAMAYVRGDFVVNQENMPDVMTPAVSSSPVQEDAAQGVGFSRKEILSTILGASPSSDAHQER